MGKKMDSLLGKGFKSSKCSALLKMAVSRIKLLKNKREIQCKQFRRDIAQLLQNGQEASARLRVEHVFREKNMLDAYFLIEGFCYLITERMVSIEKQRACPNDLKEAIASLIFAAPRCADLPELQDVRSIFAAKYGNEFSAAAAELRPDCGVNRQIIEKLSSRAPSGEIKLRLLKEIAAENGIEWNFEKAETEMLKPAEDLLDGQKCFFPGNQVYVKPTDGAKQALVPEDAKVSSELDRRPSSSAVTQTATVAYAPPVLPASPSANDGLKNKQQYLPFARQEHTKLYTAENNATFPMHATPLSKESLVFGPKPARNLDSKISEEDPYTRLRMEGKMDYNASTKSMNSTAGHQEFPNPNDIYDSTKFTKVDGMSVDLAQEKIKYSNAAVAAQAAFESAAHAAEAARAAVSLAKSESLNLMSTRSGDDWRDVNSESELDEDLEAAFSRPIHVGSGSEEMISEGEGEAIGMKSLRARKHEKTDASQSGPGFLRVHPSQRARRVSESEEEHLESQVSLSKASTSHAYKNRQPQFDDYNDTEDEYEFNALPKGGKPRAKQEKTKRTETQSNASMSHNSSNSSDQSSFYKASQPVVDNYDDEYEYEKISSGRIGHKITSNVGGRYKNEDSHNWTTPYTTNRPQFDSNDKGDQYEKVMSTKQREKQDYIHGDHNSRSQMRPRPDRGYEEEGEIKARISQRSSTRSSKPSFEDFVRQETHSFEYFNPQSDNGARSLNDFERIKFQYRNKAPMAQKSQSEDNQESPHGRSSRQGIKGMVSDDQTGYPGYAGVRRNYESWEGVKNNHSDLQTLDSDGTHRYEGVRRAQQNYANMDDQHIFVEERRQKAAYHSEQLGVDEDNRAFRGLRIGERSHLGGEYSTEMPLNHNGHFQKPSKQRLFREDVQSRPSYAGIESVESNHDEGGSRMNQMGQPKDTRHGEGHRYLKTQHQVREKQNDHLNISPQPPANKVERQSNKGYTKHHNPSAISPTSLLFSAKSTHDSGHDSSPFMGSPRPSPFVEIGDDVKQGLKSSKVRSPSEQISAISSPSSCTDDEFSERLAALRRKR
eukprot:Gb_28579 [translate_table: standard]